VKIRNLTITLSVLLALTGAKITNADAPAWMHNLVSSPIPAHDDKTDAVLLYSEEILTVQSQDKLKLTFRRAYKILRPGGRERGLVLASFDQHSKVTSMRGWCIPAQGKDYEVRDKDAIEISIPKISGSEEISDVRDKMLQIPAADVGNIVGFEYEIEETPLLLQSTWRFQGQDPAVGRRHIKDAPGNERDRFGHPAAGSPGCWGRRSGRRFGNPRIACGWGRQRILHKRIEFPCEFELIDIFRIDLLQRRIAGSRRVVIGVEAVDLAPRLAGT